MSTFHKTLADRTGVRRRIRGYAPSAGPGQQDWEPAKVLFEALLGYFGVQVAGLGGLSWRFGSLFGVYAGSCRAQMGTREAQRPQGRGLEELGLAQGRLGTRIWAQHGPNLSQVGANLGPAWAQLEPTWSQLGSMLGPDRLK